MTNKAIPKQSMLAIMICLLLAGCSNFGLTEKSNEQLYDRNGFDILSTSADRKAILVKENLSKEIHCLSPSPDFANTYSDGVSLSEIGIGGVGDTATRGASSLGGRDPAVLLTRELLYRACEFTMNNNAEPQISREIYLETLKLIERIATSSNQSNSGTIPSSAEPSAPSIFMPLESAQTSSSSVTPSTSESMTNSSFTPITPITDSAFKPAANSAFK